MTVEQIIQESVKEFKQSQAQARRNHIRKLIDYYCGSNTANYISKYFDADAFREIPCYEANFTKRFINKMSRIYTVGANRNVGSAYSNLTVMKDARMKHIERMTRLVGSVATQVVFIDDDMPHFDYRPIYYFDVHLGSNPFKPEAIVYPVLGNVDDVAYSSWSNTGISGGTITPTGCSIGTKQGFSIIGYQGNSTTNATIPHGLSKAPSFVVIKSRSSNHGWGTMHRDVGQTGTTVDGAPEYYMMRLNTDDDRDNWSADTIWDPTTTTVKIHQSSSGYWVNHNSYHYMAYIWHDVDGFQKFGQNIGNGNNSGPFVYLGFRPAIVIVKRYNNDANWALCDDERNKYNNTWGSDKNLYLNTTGKETTSASFNVD